MPKIHLYAGYHELYISSRQMSEPHVLLSTHRTVAAARKAAEREDPDAHVHYSYDILPDDIANALLRQPLANGDRPLLRTKYIDKVKFAIC